MISLKEMLPALAALLALAAMAGTAPVWADPASTLKAKEFVASHEARIRPLDVAGATAWWDANVTGSDADFARKEEAQNRIDAALSDRDTFAKLREIEQSRAAGSIDDPLTARAIRVLYLAYLEKQVDPALLKQIAAKANAVEQAFNVYRPKVDGVELTDSQLRERMKTSKDPAERQKLWEASKGVAPLIEKDLKELVALRNRMAKELGFANYHAMSLALNEQAGDELLALFDELDALTRGPFEAAKAEIDAKLAAAQGVAVADLRAYSYHDPFFQESPAVFEASLDAPYAKADLMDLCRQFYAGIGLPIEDVLKRSDLYEKKGKSPHAFCTDIDRTGDVRVLANVVPNEYWMSTMLHELGHSVYSSKNIPAALPYVLRTESHILTTEGVAMQMERFGKSRHWLEQMGVPVADADAFERAAKKITRNQLLIFSRWCQVMLRFEKAMYENPEQDLNRLWWTLVEKYQGVKPPEGRSAPDYAAKVHIVAAPVYYHNYMMGQLFASQIHHAIARELYDNADPDRVTYVNNPAVGKFMTERVFVPGKTMDWRALTKHATGSELNAKAFARDFQGR